MTCLIALGDSMTAGRYLDSPSTEAWPSLLTGVTVTNRGVGGSFLHGSAPLVRDTLTGMGAADVAVVWAGHNDVITHSPEWPYPADPRSIEHSRWAAIELDQALAAAAVPLVLWVTLAPRTHGTLTEATPTWPDIIQARIRSWNAWLCQQWPERVIDIRGRLGDVAGGLGSPALYIGDGLHINALGHAIVAGRVNAALRARGL